MDLQGRCWQWVKTAAVLIAVGSAGASLPAGEADKAYQQALVASERNDLDQALAKLDEAIQLDPSQARFRGQRGTVWIRKKEYAKGLEDLKAAIRQNVGDVGVNYQPSPSAKLSDSALRHGREQVEAMLRDRPAMNQYGAAADFLRQWAARRFAGEDIGQPIDWDPSPPLHSDAEHLAPADDERGAILVERYCTSGPNKGSERSFEELWAGAVFELHNIRFAHEYVRLHDRAAEGKVSKADFVAGILRHELRAAQQTRAFYVQVFLPWAAEKELASDPSLWFADWWPDSNHILYQFSDRSAYPWRPYARQHDWATVRFRWRQGRLGNALRMLRRMQSERGYEMENAEVQLWIGRCLLRLGKPAQAIDALSESIRLDPENAEALHIRGHAYERIGEAEKAEADLSKAAQSEQESEPGDEGSPAAEAEQDGAER